MLTLNGVSKSFGGLRAIDSLSFKVARGTITGLIGPNGAGKTTLFSVLAGGVRPTNGRIEFNGERIDGLPSHRIFAKGLVRTFQTPRPFASMTVLENTMFAARGQRGEHFWEPWIRNGAVRAQERVVRERAREILDFVGLTSLAGSPARILSGGQRKLLEIARALMAEPRMMLLDEPGAGVNPTLLGHIIDRIAVLHQNGMTFLIIEHNMDLVMRLCRPVIVMAAGTLLMQGEPDEVQRDPRVLDAYLGGVRA